ncbi:hypothetical protein [Xanthomonas theicola]|nr:hypothetical protein [Xanthomonas theicola]
MVPHIAAFAATLTFVAATTRAFAHRGKPLLPPSGAAADPATVSQEAC